MRGFRLLFPVDWFGGGVCFALLRLGLVGMMVGFVWFAFLVGVLL